MTQKLNARQAYMFRVIFEKENSIDDLVRRLHVSRRTIQRDLNVLRGYLSRFRVELDTRENVIRLIGGKADLDTAMGASATTSPMPVATSENRALYAVLELLLSDGPLKLSYLAKRLHVTSASISNDLHLVDGWLSSRKLKLIRRPGYGVEVTGDEQTRLEAIAELIHGQLSFHELMSTLRGQSVDDGRHPVDIWLRSWFPVDRLNEVRLVLSEELSNMNPPLDEAAFFAFMLHVMLTCLRIESKHHLEESERSAGLSAEIALCTRILHRLLPDGYPVAAEAMYLAKHLRGAKVQMTEDYKILPQNITAMDLAFQMSRVLNDILRLPFTGDRDLLLGLAQHLGPAIYRMKTGLSIRNPLLQEVKQRYPAYFEAMRCASKQVLEPHGLAVPESEIGYLTMHVGAAIERLKFGNVWRVKIVCPNGISSAELLASRMRNEFPQIRIVGVNAVHSLDDTDCHLIVSTVPIQSHMRPVIIVSPFLTDDDVIRLQSLLHELQRPFAPTAQKSTGLLKDKTDFRGLAEDISGRVEIHFVSPKGVSELIPMAAEMVIETGDATKAEPVQSAIEERERLGSIVIPGKRLAVLHARLSAMTRCHVAVYRIVGALSMHSVGESVEEVDTVLLILARTDKEDPAVVQLLGRLSSALVMDESIVETLRSGSTHEIRQSIFTALNQIQE